MTANYLHKFFFCYYPYICMTVFVVGSGLRYNRNQYTWKTNSSQLLRKKGMRVGNNLFHLGIIFLFFGHLVGLLTPQEVYQHFIDASTKLMIAMIVGGVFGMLCFIGTTILLTCRLFDPHIRAISKLSDIMILFVLNVQLIIGLMTIPFSAQHMNGSSMIALANWAQHIVTFRSGAADFIMGEALIFKLHLVLGATIFLLFPFTRIVHIFGEVTAQVCHKLRVSCKIF